MNVGPPVLESYEELFYYAGSWVLHPNYFIRISSDGAWEPAFHSRPHLKSSTTHDQYWFIYDIIKYAHTQHQLKTWSQWIWNRNINPGLLNYLTISAIVSISFYFSYPMSCLSARISSVLWLLWNRISQCGSLLLQKPKKWVSTCKALELCGAHTKCSINVSH